MTGSPVNPVPSSGRHVNSGTGPSLAPLDIGHANYMAVVDPSTAFWALVAKDRLAEVLSGGPLLDSYRGRSADFARELHSLRFELTPSAG